jgi:hypothetical protein
LLSRAETENVLKKPSSSSSLTLGGMGGFTPSINLSGVLEVGFRLDTSIDVRLNVPGAFTDSVRNRENAGKSTDGLKAMRNEAHPDDLIA